MRNLLLFLIATYCGAATLPLYIDTDTNTVVSPDAPTTVAGYGITDAVAGTPSLDAFLVGDGADWVTQSGQTAQTSLGVVTASFGGQLGGSASATTGGAVGFFSSATEGGAVGRNAFATDGFAGGKNASANGTGRVQLGTGTNSEDNTIQFLSSGSVTAAEFGRLAASTTAATGSTYTVLSADQVILANNSGGVAVSLISAATVGDGFRLVVKNTGTGAVTIDADGTETIDGSLTAILTNQYESITIISDGSNWFIL